MIVVALIGPLGLLFLRPPLKVPAKDNPSEMTAAFTVEFPVPVDVPRRHRLREAVADLWRESGKGSLTIRDMASGRELAILGERDWCIMLVKRKHLDGYAEGRLRVLLSDEALLFGPPREQPHAWSWDVSLTNDAADLAERVFTEVYRVGPNAELALDR
jgi:hypothetical protein